MTTPEAKKTKVLATVGVVAGVVAIALVGWGLWRAAHPPRPPLQGQMEAHTIDVSSKVPGRVVKQLVQEGDSVQAGAVLLELSLPEIDAKLGQVESLRTAAQARQSMVDEGARPEEIAAATANWERAEAGAVLARKTWERVEALYKDGLVSLQRHDEALANWQASAELARAARALADMAKKGARPGEKKAAAALAAVANDGVTEVSSLASERLVRSPIAAQVDRIVLRPGELAPAGFPLVSLVDLSDRWATFNIREDSLPGIEIGKVLEGRVPALGDRKIAFKVYYISPRADYATWRSTRQSSGYDMKTFEVRARPAADDAALRPGMTVLVDR